MSALLPVRALLAGVASGCRSQSGVAAVVLTPAGTGRLDRLLHKPGRFWGAVVPVVGESLGDKSPKAPARTDFPVILARLGFGAAAAAALASRRGESQPLAAALGAAGALASSYGGVQARAALAARAGSDLPGAVGEDLLALGLGLTAARLP
ncbi:hypothetical protein [uncultured Jatrophihabitans sp.]|uniref:hypothetical protein n=1 Tax=uncultured Jatrophihabitans sp. TaxID=1610747 RepID=UPI0035CB3BE3